MFDEHPALAGRMTGRRALVTGASSGVGRATALSLAREGASVALLALPASGLEQVTAACRRHGAEALSIEADVGDAAAVDRAFALAERELGAVDAVYCAAGISTVAAATETTDQVWERQLRTNLSGTFHVLRAAARAMVPRRTGAIVTTASELALTGQAGYLAYTATKGGVLAMTRSLAAELAAAPDPCQRGLPGDRRHAAAGRRVRDCRGPDRRAEGHRALDRARADCAAGGDRTARALPALRRVELRDRIRVRRRRRAHRLLPDDRGAGGTHPRELHEVTT